MRMGHNSAFTPAQLTARAQTMVAGAASRDVTLNLTVKAMQVFQPDARFAFVILSPSLRSRINSAKDLARFFVAEPALSKVEWAPQNDNF
jgi:hypothetical protein